MPRVIVLGLVFCTRVARVKFSVALSNSLNSRSRSLNSGARAAVRSVYNMQASEGCETDVRGMNKTCEAYEA